MAPLGELLRAVRAYSKVEVAALADLSAWARRELFGSILPYWLDQARDSEGEGFLGEIAADGRPVPETERTVVGVSRHLWTFSAAATAAEGVEAVSLPGGLRAPDPAALRAAADAAYGYLTGRFLDEHHGGFFWSVDRSGRPRVTKKQIYGQAFALYALAEYARRGTGGATRAGEARGLAQQTFSLLADWAWEDRYGGYLEALGRDWSPTEDRTLSPVDLDCDKSMNTNLHVLEALSNLYRMEPSPAHREAVVSELAVLSRSIFQEPGHLGRFFASDWSRLDRKISFGHDVEASWLLEEARELVDVATGDAEERAVFAEARRAADALAGTALEEGIDGRTGSLMDEAEGEGAPGHRAPEDGPRIWWCQAEALVGFFGAWGRGGGDRYLKAALDVRAFIDAYLVDPLLGDWRWGVDASGRPLPGYPKGGNWKTGYHNGRACMELIRRCAVARSEG